MPNYISPGVYVEEVSSPNKPIVGVETSVLGILGITEKGRSEICLISSFQEYCNEYGDFLEKSYLSYAVKGFFQNGGKRCFVGRIEHPTGSQLKAKNFIGVTSPNTLMNSPKGLSAFCKINEINIVYVPDVHILSDSEATILNAAIKEHCEQMKDRFAIIDIPKKQRQRPSSVKRPVASSYAAAYYPWLKVKNPHNNQFMAIPPGGHVAGIYSRSDITRGVHKAPANLIIKGVLEPEFSISKGEQTILNTKMINTIRQFPGKGVLVWGARTCSIDSEWKYLNVKRLIIYLEKSINNGVSWIVFEPNGPGLWYRVKQNIETFLYNVWREGALQGATPEKAFFVKCDRSTMNQSDIDNGRFICEIGVAPMMPAEFIIFRLESQTIALS